MSSRPAATTTWLTAAANTSLRTRPDSVGQLGQSRVVLDRHREQREPRAAAGERDLRAVALHVDRAVRQAAGDLGQQPAGDQGPAGLAYVGVHLDARAHLVVERGDGEAVGACWRCPRRRRARGRRAPASTAASAVHGLPTTPRRPARPDRSGTSPVTPLPTHGACGPAGLRHVVPARRLHAAVVRGRGGAQPCMRDPHDGPAVGRCVLSSGLRDRASGVHRTGSSWRCSSFSPSISRRGRSACGCCG